MLCHNDMKHIHRTSSELLMIQRQPIKLYFIAPVFITQIWSKQRNWRSRTNENRCFKNGAEKKNATHHTHGIPTSSTSSWLTTPYQFRWDPRTITVSHPHTKMKRQLCSLCSVVKWYMCVHSIHMMNKGFCVVFIIIETQYFTILGRCIFFSFSWIHTSTYAYDIPIKPYPTHTTLITMVTGDWMWMTVSLLLSKAKGTRHR